MRRLNLRTPHQQRVEEFMRNAGQDVPDEPTIPDSKTLILRAKLILEEALETVEALGVTVWLSDETTDRQLDVSKTNFDRLEFNQDITPNLVEIVDGCADLMVVTSGTLSAIGVADEPFLEEVDRHNLAKFGPGGYRRDDGKWIKPSNLQPPEIERLLKDQRFSHLKVWHNGVDYVISETQEEARQVIIDDICSTDPQKIDREGWKTLSMGEELTVPELETEEDITLTAKEWILAMGEGFLHSTETEE
jgi:predicted HAD superfamily Cof-like phosphohydrolase